MVCPISIHGNIHWLFSLNEISTVTRIPDATVAFCSVWWCNLAHIWISSHKNMVCSEFSDSVVIQNKYWFCIVLVFLHEIQWWLIQVWQSLTIYYINHSTNVHVSSLSFHRIITPSGQKWELQQELTEAHWYWNHPAPCSLYKHLQCRSNSFYINLVLFKNTCLQQIIKMKFNK